MAGSTNNKNKGRKGRASRGGDNRGFNSRPSSTFTPKKKNEPTFSREPAVTVRILEYVSDAPGGKRTLSRLARTCKALREPALNALWSELDSMVPLLWQFPSHLLKKTRKPGLGFVKNPTQEDWDHALKYAERVRQVTYNENAGNVAASIFSMLTENRSRQYIFPHLTELNWRVETPSNLNHCSMFINPTLRVLNLEVAGKTPNLNSFLAEMSNRTSLSSFSFMSTANLPNAFTHLLKRHQTLEHVSLIAPGALAAGVGRWLSSLPELKSLRLDLIGRSNHAVDSFFDELRIHSGTSTPDSGRSIDSGIFSEEDYSIICPKMQEPFSNLSKLQLSGEATTIIAFTKHLNSPLADLELTVGDPTDRNDWNDLCRLISNRFGDSLQSLKINSAGPSSRLGMMVDSVRPAQRVDQRLSLQHLRYLPRLLRLEIDLPEPVIFGDTDLESIASASPNLRILRLCPTAKANIAPKITLESLANLLIRCRRLHTIAAVVDAKSGNPDVLKSRQTSSKSLLRLHVGHSWVDDPLQVAILLSHMAPRLETLKFFQENNRPGFNEARARRWQEVADLLPHLQSIRLLEQQLSSPTMIWSEPEVPEMVDKGIEAVVWTIDQSVHAVPEFRDASLQFSPALVNQVVQAEPALRSISIHAAPEVVETAVEAITNQVSVEIDATPPKEKMKVTRPGITSAIKALITPTFRKPIITRRISNLLLVSSFLGLLSFIYRLLILYPISVPSRIIQSASAAQVPWQTPRQVQPPKMQPPPFNDSFNESSYVSSTPQPEIMDLDI